MADRFSKAYSTLESPATRAAAITPNDNADLPNVTRFLLVGVAGDVSVIMANDTSAVTLKLPAGIHPLRVKRVRVTGTVATNLVALF